MMAELPPLELSQDDFVCFLDGQTHPAKFWYGGRHWVVRYPGDAEKNLRLASELVGYRIAERLGVSVPEFRRAVITDSFEAEFRGNGRLVPGGLATACEWIEGARYPHLERGPIREFWTQERYLRIVATARVVDTWLMNFDRRKEGNIALRGDFSEPEVYFFDFDQAFLKRDSGDRWRPHWLDPEFRPGFLADEKAEVLSGFGGDRSENAQRYEHFQPAVGTMIQTKEEELAEVLNELPCEWGIDDAKRRCWCHYLRLRRELTRRYIINRYPRKGE